MTDTQSKPYLELSWSNPNTVPSSENKSREIAPQHYLSTDEYAKNVNIINYLFAYVDQQTKELKTKLASSETIINALKVEQSKGFQQQLNKIDDVKSKVFETVGLFVALLTFVSVEFQILEKSSFDDILPLTLILAGVLVMFILLMDLIINNWRMNEVESKTKLAMFHRWRTGFISLSAFSAILILIGLTFSFLNKIQIPQHNSQQIKQLQQYSLDNVAQPEQKKIIEIEATNSANTQSELQIFKIK